MFRNALDELLCAVIELPPAERNAIEAHAAVLRKRMRRCPEFNTAMALVLAQAAAEWERNDHKPVLEVKT